MIPTFTHSTTAELDLNVEYQLGPDGPEITAVFILGDFTDKQRALFLDEIRAKEAQATEAAELEHRLAGRDLE